MKSEAGAARHASIGTPPPDHLLEPERDRPRYVRSPVYVLRVVVGGVLTLAGFGFTVLFENALLGLFRDTDAMVERWPEWLQDLPVVLLAAAAGTVVAGAAVWLVFTRHWRRLATIAAATVLGVIGAVLATELLIRAATSDVISIAIREDEPERRLALFLPVLLAVVTVGLPWLRRSARSWVVLGTFTYALALVFFAVTPPLEILVHAGVGILVGAGLGLVLKTPNMAPTRGELALALSTAGIPVVRLERANVDARGSVPWFAETTAGDRVFVKVMGSGHRAADLLYRTYRWLRYRHAGDRRPFISLRRAAEHEAFGALQAGNRGIETPRFLAIADVGGDGIMLAYEHVEGRSLDVLDPDEVGDELLHEIWDLVAHLHQHGIAHRDLRCANVLVGDDGHARLVDFGFAEQAADREHMARDIAELLASTTALVGEERAADAACSAVSLDELADAIPWIQPKAMSSATKAALPDAAVFERLQARVKEAVHLEEVPEVKVERVSARTLLTLVSLGAAAYVLIPVIAGAGDLLPTLREAEVPWLMVALLASLGTYLGATLGVLGATPVPLDRRIVFVAQFASSFTNRVTPAKVGGMATNVRALQKQGVPLATAISAIGLTTVAGVLIHVPSTLTLGVVVGRDIDAISLPSATAVGWVVVVFAVLSVAVLALPGGRRLVGESLVPALRTAWDSIGSVARRPTRLVMLFGGAFIVTAMYTVAMAASLAAFGAEIGVVTTAFVYLAGAAVASAAPTPGGVGATEAALAAGYAAVGVPPEIALSGVLVFRLLTFWLPILPGWAAFSWMQRAGRL